MTFNELNLSAPLLRAVAEAGYESPSPIQASASPPVLAASPASVFALLAGQVMMVVRADETSEDEIREAVALLDGCDNIQLVLNQVRHRPAGDRFGDYYAPSETVK